MEKVRSLKMTRGPNSTRRFLTASIVAEVWSQMAGSKPDVDVGIEERVARVKGGGTEKPSLSREMTGL
jgi:hypothetical protein